MERTRGLDFEHPVAVDFLPDDEFRQEVTGDEADLSDEDREELEAFAGAFRALGLVEGDVDLFADVNTLSGEGILAYYDYEDQRVSVRGTDLTVGVRATLAHELTHVLQDQHFDLSRLDDDDATSGETAAFQALVEGDAQRIEREYVAGLGERELREYEEELEATHADVDYGDVPPVFQAYFGAPYVLGEGLLAVLVSRGGNEAVDEAFRSPPTSEEHLIDPWTYLDDDGPVEVELPELEDGEEEVDSGDFGAITWYLALAERLDPRRALDAVDGWGGDAYRLFLSGERSCVRIDYVADSDGDLRDMASALEDWVAAFPGGTAQVERRDDQIRFESCDPGAEADLGVQGTSLEALQVPVGRTSIVAELVAAGVPRGDSECVAREVIGTLTPEQLLGLEEVFVSEEGAQEVIALFQQAAQTCGLPEVG